jgi:hypothetical protein
MNRVFLPPTKLKRMIVLSQGTVLGMCGAFDVMLLSACVGLHGVQIHVCSVIMTVSCSGYGIEYKKANTRSPVLSVCKLSTALSTLFVVID